VRLNRRSSARAERSARRPAATHDVRRRLARRRLTQRTIRELAMDGMFEFGMPWWQLIVRAVIVYIVLFALIRLSGKHTLGELSIFDLIVVIVLGSAVRTSLIGNDKSLQGGLIVVVVLLLLDWISTWLATHFT